MWKMIGRFLCWANAHSLGEYNGDYVLAHAYATCRRCGKSGPVDSQGNIF